MFSIKSKKYNKIDNPDNHVESADLLIPQPMRPRTMEF